LGEAVRADCERILGPDHLTTLASQNNLAFAYRQAGRLNEAIPLFERTLTTAEEVLGPKHPNTLDSQNNLALAYQQAGRLNEAIPLLQRTLTTAERVLGRDHHQSLPSQPRGGPDGSGTGRRPAGGVSR
jgi:tetratricopeptide (TPR) repeat protein